MPGISIRPFVYLLGLLALTLLLSIAVGAVFIPPRTVARMLLSILPGTNIPPLWPESISAIVYQIRLPHTALIALTGAALAGSGANPG